jgi:DNA-directed RNA polymerase II subunit RPB2
MDDFFDTVAGEEIKMDYDLSPADEEITQEDAWIVIDRYFEEKGLVRQQIDSFDEFITNTIQELIDDAGEIIVKPEKQYLSLKDIEQHGNQIKFGQVYVSPPTIFEADGEQRELYPQEARLRSLTYQSQIFVDIYYNEFVLNENGKFDWKNDQPVYSKKFEMMKLGKKTD